EFSDETFKKLLVNFIVADDQLRELVIEAWRKYFHNLKPDTWSNQNHRSFLTITAHWIAKVGGMTNLQLKSALIVFHHLVGHQTVELLAKVILVLLDRAGITKKAIGNGNDMGHFIDENKKVVTAIDYFLALPNRSNIKKLQISQQEWQQISDFEIILEVSHDVQQAMCKESTPILSSAIPSLERFMMDWEQLAQKNSVLKPFVDPGLAVMYQYYSWMDETKAYIIAMVINPEIWMTWITDYWDSKYVKNAKEKVMQMMGKYREQADSGVVTTQAMLKGDSTGSPQKPTFMSLRSKYGLDTNARIGRQFAGKQTIEQEYQTYISAMPQSIDIIKFWENNQTNFLTLYAMAMDYLPIQA
ncbi:ribonuclease H-like domain-containing protein, partial [Lactarius quietus]